MKYSVAATATALAMLGTGLVQAEDTCVTSMYGGGSSTCVILTGKIEGPGKGKCWGTGAFGRLGQGNVQNLGDQPNEMGVFLPIIDVGTGKLIEQFGNGYQHQCVRLNDGTAKCWGYNNLGQLGQGDTEDRGDQPNEMGDNLPAINVGSGRTVKFITAGTGFTCVILDTEDVKCWGANPFGELGLGDTLNRGNVTGQMGDDLPIVSLGSGLKAVEVRGGGWHVCVRITSNNRIKCWGHNIYGQLGLGDTLPRGDGPNEMGDNLPFVDLGAVSTVMQIGIGDLFTCILLTNSKIKCYGFNLDGELGQGVDDQPVGGDPTDMGDNLLYTDIGSVTPDFISCGQESCCVYLTPAGTGIKCWGFNNRGRLGYGDTIDRGDNPGEMGDSLPLVNVGTGMIILEVVTLGTHVCVRIDDQIDLKCWGNNGQGRLGIGNTVHKGDDSTEMGNNLGWTPICPTASPTKNPTKTPTNSPTPPTKSPTKSPSAAGATPNPTNDPTKVPTTAPTYSPTNKPTVSPTKKPTNAPSFSPTNKPTFSPTNKPTNDPSFSPTKRPSAAPVTSAPSAAPVTPVPTTSGQTLSPSLSPTKKPSITPSASPSKKPTNAPSFSPTKKPSNNPTVTPSRVPTAQPTSSPSKSPTQKPISFNKFFGSGGESIGGISSLDLYYLIDRSGSIKDIDYKCKKVQTISGNPAPSCWDLMLGYAIELVKAIATVTGYYDANNPKSGLRVMAVAFFCKPSQDIPDYVNILPSLTGKEVDILDGLNNARKKMNPEGGSCPDTALMRFIQQVEDVWSESKDRPFKLLVTITDAVFYNGQTTESTLLERELYTLKQRCTPGLTMTIDIKNQLLNEKQKLVQERYLQVFTNGVKASRFDLLPGQPVTLQNMGVQMGNLLATQFNNPTCTDPTAFTTPGSLWCGYTTEVRCDVRAGCKWFGELGCLVDPQITGCGFTSKRTCKKASGCKWLSKKGTSACVKDVDFTDCGSIFLAKSCKEKSLCKWKASTCINKTTG